MNYYLAWHDSSKNNAGPKAKEDAMYFLSKQKFQEIKTPRSSILKVFWLVISPLVFMLKDGIIIIQFPSGSPKIRRKIIQNIKRFSKLKIIFLVHDIEALRSFNDGKNIVEAENEFSLLKKADGLIVQTKREKNYLKEKGIKSPISIMELWDYRINKSKKLRISHKNNEKTVCFTGNLIKAPFIQEYNDKCGELVVYGPNPEKYNSKLIRYEGEFSPEVLPEIINESFGLIWDGTSINTCEGTYGKYLEYNIPHKLSLYIMAQIPVIVWENAIASDFIIKNKIGITINKIEEIPQKIKSISDEEYREMVSNVCNLKNKIQNGSFIKKAINDILEKV